jgi:hypothetical protein
MCALTNQIHSGRSYNQLPASSGQKKAGLISLRGARIFGGSTTPGGAQILELMTGIEPVTSSLPRTRSTD